MKTEKYLHQQAQLPATGQFIIANYDTETITVYQAFNDRIAKYAVEKQKFGGAHYSFQPMTRIKPNFMWMMYRAGWATKQNQVRGGVGEESNCWGQLPTTKRRRNVSRKWKSVQRYVCTFPIWLNTKALRRQRMKHHLSRFLCFEVYLLNGTIHSRIRINRNHKPDAKRTLRHIWS